jgi:tetratricopeptide (TPR) repeat protein
VLFCAALALAATMRSVGAPGWSPARTVPLTPAPRHRGAFGLAGLAFGLLASGQPAALVAAVPALWLLYRRESAGLRRPRATAARGGAAADLRLWFVGGIALPLLLTLFYNGIGGGTWSAPAVNGGINLYIGNGPEANGGYVRPAGTREDRDLLGIAAAAAALGKKDGVNAARANSYWTGKALGFALSHPLRTIGLYIRKVLFFFGQYEIPQVESLPFERRYSWILRIPLPGMALLFALGLFGALLLWREDRTARWLAASAAALALGVSVFFVTARFRLPVVPFLAVLAGGGISRAASLLRPSPADRVADARGLRRGPILIPAAVALALGSLLCVNLTGIRAKASEGQYHFRLGVIAEKDQHPDEAMREYAQAISLDPTLGKAEVNWGTLMARGGNLEGARVHLERGVALDPLSAVGLVNLGQIDQLQGDPESALALFQRAIEVDPSSLSARESAALLLYERGKLDEARTNLEFIVRSAPAGSPPALRAGSLLRILKDRDSLAPAWTSCGALLRGDLRLAQGDAAGAAVLYREAAADSQAAEAARRMLATLPR